ncbi:MAG: M20/M25/M40 family metallo-hydrolase [Deltaproteobacteria bacterium]|nr:MAG: M20/M25/M40 family metallo-hydrolase [Deltaproteobacteria bacterium]
MRTDRSLPFLLGLALLAAIGALAGVRHGPPAVPSAASGETAFSSERARALLEPLVGDGVPHPAGSEAAARVRARIVEALRRSGYAPIERTGFGCSPYGACADVRNVLARLPGREPGPAVLLASHYDSQPAGPGASDDGVGTVVMLEIARAIRAGPPLRNDVIFLFDEGEEYGLLGAEAFVASDPWAGDVAVVLNIEARGTTGASVMFETSPRNAALVDVYARSVAHPRASSAFSTVYERLPNDTDLTVFKRHGYAGLNFAHAGNVEHYHTPLDDVDHVVPATIQHHGESLLAVTRALADAELPLPATHDAVFFDLFGFALVRWPAAATLPIALAALALSALLASRAARRHALAGREGLFGVAAWPLAIGLAALAGLALTGLLQWLHGVETPWTAHPTPTRAALFALAALGVAVATQLVASRSGPLGLLYGAGVGWAVVATALAATLPGLAFLFLVPSLAFGVAVGVAGLARPGADAVAGRVGSAGLVLAAGVLWLPVALSVEDALGLRAGALVAASVALAGSGAMPLLAAAPRPGRRALLAVAGGVALGATAVALLRSPYSDSHPRHLSLMFHQDADANAAQWLLSAQHGAPPAELRGPARWVAPDDPPLPILPGWYTHAVYSRPAQPVNARGPELTVLEQTATPEGRRVRVRIRSPRGAPVVEIWVPPEVEPVAVTLRGTRFPPQSERMLKFTRGWRRYAYVTAPRAGYELEFVLREREPVPIYLIDQSYDLPPTAAPILEARPDWAVPVASGDSWVVSRRLRL